MEEIEIVSESVPDNYGMKLYKLMFEALASNKIFEDENKLKVKAFETRLAMGKDAAKDVSIRIKELLESQESVNIILLLLLHKMNFFLF